jgi:alpha-L-arabinofuranosidase
MVNRGLEDLDVEITLDSFEVQGKPEVSVITGESLYLVNDAASPEKVVTRTYELESLEDLAVLKAHTIYALTVRGKVIR